MSGSIVAPAGPATTPPGDDGTPAHEHAWGLMRFELVDDRPMVQQRCDGCGAVRRYRAWERYWTPGAPEVRR